MWHIEGMASRKSIEWLLFSVEETRSKEKNCRGTVLLGEGQKC